MATTNRTFDVAVWSAPSDRGAAVECARTLVQYGLRVTVPRTDHSATSLDAASEVRQSPARVNLAVATARTARAWTERSAVLEALLRDPNTLTLLGPDVSTEDAQRLERGLAGRVWNVRAAWRNDDHWRALSRQLVDAGTARETQIQPRSSLGPASLQVSTIRSYDQIADRFAEQWFDHPPRRELDLFLRQLGPKSRILDAGCGPGHHARMLLRDGCDVVAIDLSDGMLAQARKRVRSIRLIKMNIETLSFDAGSFDAIWCAAAILHVPREHVVPLLKGFRRVLKPRGLLGLNFQIGRQSEVVQRGEDHRFFEYYLDAPEMISLLEIAGFSVASALSGETTRNTHDLNLTLKWMTLYARSTLGLDLVDAPVAGKNGPAQVELGFAPREKIHLVDS